MKIKRFVAPDMRQAIRTVREELGPDAVILSNERVSGGVEIVAAIDYDESLLPRPAPRPRNTPVPSPATAPAGDESRPATQSVASQLGHAGVGGAKKAAARHAPPPRTAARATTQPALPQANIWSQEPTLLEMRRELNNLRGLLVNQLSGLAWGETTRSRPLYARLLQRLLGLGLSPALARSVAEDADKSEDFEHNWRQALGWLAHHVPVTGDDIIDHGGVVALVGPTGVGKTTTVAKLAARYSLRHGPGRVALVTTDSFRVGAHEQLRIYARILGVPLRIANNPEQLLEVLSGLRDKALVLIDTAGMSQRDMRLSEQFALLHAEGSRIQSYLVMATTAQRSVLDETVRAFQAVALRGCILTKVDESTSLGSALSVAIEQRLAVAYVSDGQRVPEDMHPARAHSLVSRSVAIMQHGGGTTSREVADSLAIGGMVAHAHG